MALGIGSVGIGSSSLFALNAINKSQNTLTRTMAQLSSGNQLINGSINPSGLAIASAMSAQISGIGQAINNVQDTGNLLQTADTTLNTQSDILGQMRDLAVRSGNEATLTPQDQQTLDTQFQSLSAELTRTGQASNFNGKQLTTDVAGQQFGTQVAQVGPNNSPSNQENVTINASTANTLGPAGQAISTQSIATTAGAQSALTAIDQAMNQVNTQRANLGAQQEVSQFQQNDLATSQINLAAAHSQIADTNFASTISEQTTASLLNKISIATLSQSNAQAFGVLKLLGA